MLSNTTNLSNKASMLIITTLCFIILSTHTEAAAPYTYYCPNTTACSANSLYRSNLNLLLSSLSSNSTRSGTVFSTSTVGQSPPNVAYGLFLCRGDITTRACHDCVSNATEEITTLCPNQKSAVIWYPNCMLRYDNDSFFSTLDVNIMFSRIQTANGYITEQARFLQMLSVVMDQLANRATADSPNDQFVKGFATQQAKFTSLPTIYGLVQCTQDLSDEDCKRCLRIAIDDLPQCCTGRPGGVVLLPSCNVRFETFSFYRELAAAPAPTPMPVPAPMQVQAPVPVPVPLLVPSSPPPSSLTRPSARGKGKISPRTVIAIAIAIAVSVLLFAMGYCCIFRKSKRSYDTVKDETDAVEITNVQPLQFDLGTIQAATNFFSDENKIGEGGFGIVYKGTLANGQEIAVKRLSKTSRQGALEFKNEVVLVAKLQHRNLVRLLGFCFEGGEKILMYEYVHNKSLDYFLFDPEKQGQLDWPTRYKIIGGIARGMLYLHEDSRLRIIHRDLKASNILLDAEMNAKVSDFGIARIFGVDQTRGNTSKVVGTYGYMSPEYLKHGQFSVRSDVFSFGVLVLEIISGKKNGCNYQSNSGEDLLSHAWKLWEDGTPLKLMDPTLPVPDTYLSNEVIRCIHMGLLCVQEDVNERPSMGTIVLMLSSYSESLPVLFCRRTQSTCKSVMVSVDEDSITQVHPR